MGKNLRKIVSIAAILAVSSSLSTSIVANASITSSIDIAKSTNSKTDLIKTSSSATGTVSFDVEDAKPSDIKTDAAGNFEYTKNNDSITLIKYVGTPKDGNVELEDSFDGIPITKISENTFKDRTDITTIKISGSVTSIDPNAFSGCKNLKSFTKTSSNGKYSCKDGILYYDSDTSNELVKVPQALATETFTIPDNTISLSNYAFEGCTSISNIIIPKGVATIGGANLLTDCSTFANCQLKSINVNSENANFSSIGNILFDKNQTILIKYPQALAAANYELSDKVKSLANNAFQGCSSLSSLIITNVNSLGDNSFDGCGLTQLTLGTSVTTIGKFAFNNCKSLASIDIPRTVTDIGYGAFNNCDNLSLIRVNPYNNNYTTEGGILYKYEKPQLKFASSINDKSITGYAPDSLPKTITTNDGKTTKDLLPNSAYNLHFLIDTNGKLNKYESFTGNVGTQYNKGTTTDVSTNTAYINYDEITNIIPYEVVPQKWTEYASASLETNAAPYTLSEKPDATAIAPIKDLKTINLILVRCPQTIIQDEVNKNLNETSKYTIKQIEAFAFQHCNKIQKLTIPQTVSAIGGSAFKDCSALQDITLNNDANSALNSYEIGSYAFNNCSSLSRITLPTALNSINAYTFNNCINLQHITFNSATKYVNSTAFDGCNKLQAFETKDTATVADRHYAVDKGILFDTRTANSNRDTAKANIDSITKDVILTQLVKYPTAAIDKDSNLIKTYTVPVSVNYIQPYAFRDSEKPAEIKVVNLQSIILPNQGIQIRNNALYQAAYNTSVDANKTFISMKVTGSISNDLINPTLDILNDSYFVKGKEQNSITLSNIKASATDIIAIPNDIVIIKKDAFNGLSASGIKLSTKISSIEDGAFDNCSGVLSYNVDAGNTKFESNPKGFESNPENSKNCLFEKPALTDKNNNPIYNLVKYPSAVTDLSYVTPDNTTKISNKAFENALFRSVTLGKLVSDVQATSFTNCTRLQEIKVADGNTDYKSIDGVLFTFDGKTLVKYPDAKTEVSYALPNGVEKIRANAFSNNKNIKEVKTTNSNVTVEDKAFAGTQVEKLTAVTSTNIDPIVKPDVHVTAIEVNANTFKTNYTVGEDLDVTNSTIKATKDSGTTDNIKITASMVSGYDKTKVGSQTLTVSYGTLKATYVITVNQVSDPNAKISSISLNKDTFKTSYNVGQDLDLTNSTIKVLKSDNTSTDVKVTSDMVSGYDKFKAIAQTITISYQGQQTTVNVTVVDPAANPAPTGDTSNMMLAGSLVTIAMAGLAFVSIRKKSEIEE